MAEVKYENGIMGFIPQDVWLNTGFRVDRPNDPIDGLFTDEKTDNITARWQTIASEFQIPVMAHFHAFDTEANKTFRIPIDTHNIEKGLIKVKINQSERMRELLRTGVQQNELYNYVMNDGYRLADQVITRTKVAKNELLATGKVTIKENDLDLTVDYGVPTANTSLKLVVNDTSDVPGQIQKIVDTAVKNGVTITGMVTSRQNISKLRMNKSIQTLINGNAAQGMMVRRGDLESFLSQEFGINRIILNDLTYGADAKIDAKTHRPVITQQRYFPIDKITFFGTANNMSLLGTGLWGDPPEVTGVQAQTGATASGVSPYVYITQWVEKDPAELWTKASALFMPVLYDPNSLYVATVSDK